MAAPAPLHLFIHGCGKLYRRHRRQIPVDLQYKVHQLMMDFRKHCIPDCEYGTVDNLKMARKDVWDITELFARLAASSGSRPAPSPTTTPPAPSTPSAPSCSTDTAPTPTTSPALRPPARRLRTGAPAPRRVSFDTRPDEVLTFQKVACTRLRLCGNCDTDMNDAGCDLCGFCMACGECHCFDTALQQDTEISTRLQAPVAAGPALPLAGAEPPIVVLETDPGDYFARIHECIQNNKFSDKIAIKLAGTDTAAATAEPPCNAKQRKSRKKKETDDAMAAAMDSLWDD